MVNLYQLLNIPPNADAAMIQAVLQHAQASGSLEPKVIKAAQEWLLKPDVRARYDAKLRQEYPEFFASVMPQQPSQTAPSPALSAFDAPKPPPHAPAAPENHAESAPRRKKTPVLQALAGQTPTRQTNAHAAPHQMGNHGQVQLWNPKAAMFWSLLFNIVFAAVLHALNWKRLGNEQLAKMNWLWVGGYILALIAIVILAPNAGIPINIALVVAWYYHIGKKQVDFVEQQFNGQYQRRGWVLPILAAIVLTVIFAIVIGLFMAARCQRLGNCPI